MTNPDPYDDVAHAVMSRTKASSVILLVVDGTKGTGLSLLTVHPELVGGLPVILRRMANELEKDGPDAWAPLTRGQA